MLHRFTDMFTAKMFANVLHTEPGFAVKQFSDGLMGSFITTQISTLR